MKKSLLLSILLTAYSVHAEIKMVPLDIDLGYWETSSEILQNDAMNKMLENMPEAQRAMMLEMMQSKMKTQTTRQCITPDLFKDPEKKVRDSMGDQYTGQDCHFEAINSSSKSFSGKLSCKNMEVSIQTNVINSKRQESIVESSISGMGATKLRMVSEWKSKTCPEGL